MTDFVNIAEQKLNNKIDHYGGKNVDCYIGAYAKSGQGTAICVIDGININQKLVDAGFSQNVSLF